MKTMIVFIALVLVFSMFLLFTADMARYRQIQSQLKILAEECACGAALLTGDKNNHTAVIRESDAQVYVIGRISITLGDTNIFNKGYISSQTKLISPTAIKVTLSYSARNNCPVMHFVGMDGDYIVRSSVYEWVLQ